MFAHFTDLGLQFETPTVRFQNPHTELQNAISTKHQL
jgi:hypothetical protein